MTEIPVFLNVRDRVTHLREMVRWLEDVGQENITLLDNASTYPPCVEYLEQQAELGRVKYLGQNVGHLALFWSGLAPAPPFFYSDPDLIFLGPHDGLQHLFALSKKYPDKDKIGFGLSIEGAPASMPSLKWEQELWSANREIEPGVFDSPVDTTFAIYNRPTIDIWNSLRTGAPYVCKHPSWWVDPLNLTEEDAYYLENRKDGPWASWWND